MRASALGSLLCLVLLGAADSRPAEAGGVVARLESVRKIWDRARHNAFTDLARFGGRIYCTFREGAGHGSIDGKIRILSTEDGKNWRDEYLFVHPDRDLRDPKLSVTPDGRLMMLCGATRCAPDGRRLFVQTMVSFSRDGRKWLPLRFVTQPHRWLWRVTWHKGLAYGVAYGDRSSGLQGSELLVSENGVDYRRLCYPLLAEGWPTEATIRFDEEDTAYCLHRRDGSPNNAYFGRARPPYTEWEWRPLPVYVGGPNLIRTSQGHWLVCGRRLGAGGPKTVLWQLDPEQAQLRELVVFPSGGDTSYPGMLFVGDRLWVSYYSSHEGKSAIYLAILTLEE